MILLVALGGYVIGSLPTADGLGRLWGVDLRARGTKNPGARNALLTGGPLLAALVVLVEISKGLAAVTIGVAVAGEAGAVAAGLAAVTGNIYNVWYRFGGGKGLGISAGVLLGLCPVVMIPAGMALAVVVRATGSSGAGALTGLATLLATSAAWWVLELPTGWGIGPGPVLTAGLAGLGVVLWPKHSAEASFRRRSPA